MSRPQRIKKMSLSKALDKYYATVSVHKRGHQQEFYRVRVIQRHPLAEKMMDEITTVDIASYRDDRLSQVNTRTGRCISGNTVRLELALLSSLYNLASVEWGTCRTNPVEMVRKPKISGGRDRRLTSQEERRLSRYFQEQNPALHAIFHLAIETAMRQGEILSLRWEHIDLQHGVAHLPMTKNGSSRDVPLSRKARHLLQGMTVALSGNVFHYSSSGFKSAWRVALQRLNIVDLHFHDLRHEAISRLFELGTLNVMEVAAISGHRSLNMLKRYTHLRAYQLVSKLDARRRQTLLSLILPVLNPLMKDQMAVVVFVFTYPILTIFQCQRHRGRVRWRLQVFCCYERWLKRLSGESVCLAPGICRKASMSG
ncbi:shufflon-specific DNA recombinase [Salmonella enterica subsp. enterica serovar Typhi]|nr:shufflon-specific DNA recombinase [Salmonella enterica subsp. enterica serovar Typhi]CGM74371.1 shufflon-specific DNA recombinase [Salmonella enterica subsp. enterica serovar Typhi]CGM83204.1 shufflon-specific DNA recombinase [Salmonella enterica subsp. enterica serovar Typhi]CGM95777.1 shufflon-specific DNA recombinase [Salmonella enterica subsp. enterica serovar Typhi]CGN00411.1 shufflon-specific DNA recombinase [Salmonella enterica subsp. enterica serovar Typhi]